MTARGLDRAETLASAKLQYPGCYVAMDTLPTKDLFGLRCCNYCILKSLCTVDGSQYARVNQNTKKRRDDQPDTLQYRVCTLSLMASQASATLVVKSLSRGVLTAESTSIHKKTSPLQRLVRRWCASKSVKITYRYPTARCAVACCHYE